MFTAKMDGRPSPVLVTGAAGFVGSHLVERLITDGHLVRGLDDRIPPGLDDAVPGNLSPVMSHPRFKPLPLDIVDADLASVVSGCDIVYHLAAVPGVRDSWGRGFERYARVNVLGTQRLLDACASAGVKRLVYASSSSVYGVTGRPSRESDPVAPASPYGVSKLAGEQLCLAYAGRSGSPLSVSAVRYFTVYGPRQRSDMAVGRILLAALTGSPFTLYGDGTQRREFTYVSDAVAATVQAAAIDARTEVVNVGGGSSVSIAEALEIAHKVTGRPVRTTREGERAGDVPVTEADLSYARAVLGFRPAVNLHEGMERHAEWLAGLLQTSGRG